MHRFVPGRSSCRRALVAGAVVAGLVGRPGPAVADRADRRRRGCTSAVAVGAVTYAGAWAPWWVAAAAAIVAAATVARPRAGVRRRRRGRARRVGRPPARARRRVAGRSRSALTMNVLARSEPRGRARRERDRRRDRRRGRVLRRHRPPAAFSYAARRVGDLGAGDRRGGWRAAAAFGLGRRRRSNGPAQRPAGRRDRRRPPPPGRASVGAAEQFDDRRRRGSTTGATRWSVRSAGGASFVPGDGPAPGGGRRPDGGRRRRLSTAGGGAQPGRRTARLRRGRRGPGDAGGRRSTTPARCGSIPEVAEELDAMTDHLGPLDEAAAGC